MKKGSAFWMDHVAAIKQEGISTSAYAKRHGIAVKRLYYWQRKAAVAIAARAIKPRPFIALRVAPEVGGQTRAHCTLVLASGVRLEMTALPAPEWLAALGRTVQGSH